MSNKQPIASLLASEKVPITVKRVEGTGAEAPVGVAYPDYAAYPVIKPAAADTSKSRASKNDNILQLHDNPRIRGHRHTVHAGSPEAPHIEDLENKGVGTANTPSSQPALCHLCTKCDSDNKDGKPAIHRSKSGSRPTYIMASRSFQAPSSPRGMASPSSVTGLQPIFDRSRIVKQELLVDGTSIESYYDINIGNLGKGSYGAVIKAKEKRSGQVRAVKIVNKPKIENITRLKREILIMKKLDHPNIIKLFEVYEDPKNLYLVLELCTGGELFDRIIKSGHFSERYAASVMKQVLHAMVYCHSNDIMHRDLKPENLLYADPSPLSALKVIDWGFAAKCPQNHKFTSVVGTPYYVAPEVLFGNYDKNCDLWSAGVVLYILLCGYPPFHGKDNQEILRKVKMGDYCFDSRHWKRVSDHAKSLVRQMLTYDPRRRITAAGAQQHAWIQQFNQPVASVDNPLSSKLGSDLMEKFKNFQRFNKMKKLAVTCVAYQLSEKEIGTLHDIFHALDKNGDGVLTSAEVAMGMENMQVRYGDDIKELLAELDTDASGTIDYTEFIAASIDHKLYEQESVCRAAFAVFDIDGDGKISIDELHKVLEMSFVQEAFTREMIEEIVKEVDINNDGSIDFQEFLRMMRGSSKKKLEVGSKFSRARALLYKRLE